MLLGLKHPLRQRRLFLRDCLDLVANGGMGGGQGKGEVYGSGGLHRRLGLDADEIRVQLAGKEVACVPLRTGPMRRRGRRAQTRLLSMPMHFQSKFKLGIGQWGSVHLCHFRWDGVCVSSGPANQNVELLSFCVGPLDMPIDLQNQGKQNYSRP
jgi:hypothetical protein